MASEDATPDPISTVSSLFASSSLDSSLHSHPSAQTQGSLLHTLITASNNSLHSARRAFTLVELEQIVIMARGRPVPPLDEKWRSHLLYTIEPDFTRGYKPKHRDVRCGLIDALYVYLEEEPAPGAARSYIQNLNLICKGMHHTYCVLLSCMEDSRVARQMRSRFKAVQGKLVDEEREIGKREGNGKQREHDMELLQGVNGRRMPRGGRILDRCERVKAYAEWACFILDDLMQRIEIRTARITRRRGLNS